MTTPSGQISAQDIKNEFGEVSGTVPLGNYRVSEAKGQLTLNIGDGVPGPGQSISFDNLRNKRLNIVVDYYSGGTITRQDQGDSLLNAKTKYNDNNGVHVIGNLKSKPSNTAAHRVRIHVNKTIGSAKGSQNNVALRTGGWDSDVVLSVDVGGSGRLYGAGGDGKSMAAWALAKHISLGLPFEVQNNVVPIKKGKVLILNADQPKVQLREQLREQDYKMDNNTVVINGFQIKREYYFAQLIKKHKPKFD